MITRMSHATLYVLDQDQALEFYTKKLGFEVRTDATMDGFRWLTVGTKSQPDLEIVLMPIMAGPMLDEATAKTVREMVGKGVIGGGVLATDDCDKTYTELKEQGVTFLAPPQQRPYGREAIFKDDSGNWFSLTQR